MVTSDQGESALAADHSHESDYGSRYSSEHRGAHSSPREPNANDHLQDLAQTIETVIIPRLRVNLGVSGLPAREKTAHEPELGPEVVETFTKLVMSQDNREAFRFIESLFERNVSLESVLLDLMAPAARHMGKLWVTDSCSFVDVTLGMTRIQQILRQSRQIAPHLLDKVQSKGQILLIPVPGEQHTFGLRIIEELLMRDGWDVTSNLRASVDDAIQMVSLFSYDVIGLSVSRERLLDPLHSIITFIRHHSLNRSVRIIVGGVVFNDKPELANLIDSDAVLTDIRQLLATANSLSRSIQLDA